MSERSATWYHKAGRLSRGIKKHRARTFTFDDSFYVEIVQRNSTYRWLRRYDFCDDLESAMIFDAEAPYWATIQAHDSLVFLFTKRIQKVNAVALRIISYPLDTIIEICYNHVGW